MIVLVFFYIAYIGYLHIGYIGRRFVGFWKIERANSKIELYINNNGPQKTMIMTFVI